MTLLAAVFGGVGTAAATALLTFAIKRDRAQARLINRLRLHLITTCMDKADGLEELARLFLSDTEEQ